MPFLSSCLACIAVLQATSAPLPAKDAQATSAALPPKDAQAVPSYVSPFAGFLRFDAEVPAKPWRAANEEVRAAGGHVGILKSRSGAPAAAKPEPGKPSSKEAPAASSHSHGEPR
jgi:hypothetical protein